jgi:hypothetical protein
MLLRRFLILVLLLVGLIAPVGAQDLDSWNTNWDNRSIDLDELQSGGVPRDGIPALDDPSFVPIAAAADWLKDQEPVLVLDLNGVARAYPLQIMTWHEIVNDEVGGVPVAVTFCPLCYSAIAYDRRVGDRTLTFGVSGLLRHSDLVMYDRQTESLWQQLNGKAIVGDLTGQTLEPLPAQLISFAQFREVHPGGEVLSRETGYDRRYGQNPYAGYDDIDKQPFLYRGPTDGRVPPMEKVVTVSVDDGDKAYPYSITRERRVIHDTIGEQPLVVFHADGAVSALDRSTIHESKETGSTGVFDPRVDDRLLQFDYVDGHFVDAQTGSTWTITGKAIDGPLEGAQMEPIPHGDFFSFAWFAFKPDAMLYEADSAGSR